MKPDLVAHTWPSKLREGRRVSQGMLRPPSQNTTDWEGLQAGMQCDLNSHLSSRIAFMVPSLDALEIGSPGNRRFSVCLFTRGSDTCRVGFCGTTLHGLERLIFLPLLPGCWNGRSDTVWSMPVTGNGFLRSRTLHESTGIEKNTVKWLSPLRLCGSQCHPHLRALGQQCDSHSWNGPARCLGQQTQPCQVRSRPARERKGAGQSFPLTTGKLVPTRLD